MTDTRTGISSFEQILGKFYNRSFIDYKILSTEFIQKKFKVNSGKSSSFFLPLPWTRNAYEQKCNFQYSFKCL